VKGHDPDLSQVRRGNGKSKDINAVGDVGYNAKRSCTFLCGNVMKRGGRKGDPLGLTGRSMVVAEDWRMGEATRKRGLR